GHHGEVVGGDRGRAAVDVPPAGDHAVGGRLAFVHRALGEVRPGVDADLDEGAVIDQQVDPLPPGELAPPVLDRGLLLPPAEFGRLAALVEVLDQVLHPGRLAALDLVGGLRSLGAVLLGRVRLLRLALLRLVLRCHQRPFHSGSRFSKKALTPSWMSSVEKVSDSWERRNSSASSSAMSCWRYMASWPRRISTGLFEASFVAHSSTAASNSPAGTTLLASP